jgi:hypothetical protein
LLEEPEFRVEQPVIEWRQPGRCIERERGRNDRKQGRYGCSESHLERIDSIGVLS